MGACFARGLCVCVYVCVCVRMWSVCVRRKVFCVIFCTQAHAHTHDTLSTTPEACAAPCAGTDVFTCIRRDIVVHESIQGAHARGGGTQGSRPRTTIHRHVTALAMKARNVERLMCLCPVVVRTLVTNGTCTYVIMSHGMSCRHSGTYRRSQAAGRSGRAQPGAAAVASASGCCSSCLAPRPAAWLIWVFWVWPPTTIPLSLPC